MQNTSFFGNTDPGKVRQNNEDAFVIQNIWDDNHVLGVAIDGVGGYEGGEEAARIAQETIVKYLEKFPDGERLHFLKQAVAAANTQIIEGRNNNPKFSQMSCVLSAVLVEVEKRQINMVHIGDTRVYQFHQGKLKKLSHDHSYVGYREDINDLTEEEAMNHPKRNEINRMLGDKPHQIDDRDFLEAETFELLPNTILLLCSDGLTDLVTSTEISEILSQNQSLEEKTQSLIDLANKKGGKDNITVVLIDYQNDEDNNIKNAQEDKEKVSEDTTKRKVKLSFMFWILILAFLTGVVCGWFGNDYYYDRFHKEKETLPVETPTPQPADSIPPRQIDSLKVNPRSKKIIIYLSDTTTIHTTYDSIQHLKIQIPKLEQ